MAVLYAVAIALFVAFVMRKLDQIADRLDRAVQLLKETNRLLERDDR